MKKATFFYIDTRGEANRIEAAGLDWRSGGDCFYQFEVNPDAGRPPIRLSFSLSELKQLQAHLTRAVSDMEAKAAADGNFSRSLEAGNEWLASQRQRVEAGDAKRS
jgi:hypothetical protein